MSSLELLKSVTIALVLAVIGVTGFVYLNPFDPMWKFATVIAMGVVSLAGSVVFFYAALKSES
jgi:hypothetical protein